MPYWANLSERGTKYWIEEILTACESGKPTIYTPEDIHPSVRRLMTREQRIRFAELTGDAYAGVRLKAMKTYREIFQKVANEMIADNLCPNCGGQIKQYIDDPNDDAVARCEVAVRNKWEGKYSNCYAEEEY